LQRQCPYIIISLQEKALWGLKLGATLSDYLKNFNTRINDKNVIVTPEYFLTGFPPQINYTEKDVKRVLQESEMPIFLGFAESANGLSYSSYLGKIEQEIMHARKLQAYKKTERRYIIDWKKRPNVWKTCLGKLAILLCYDAYRVSKEPGKYFNKSIDIILVPSFWKLRHDVLLQKCGVLSKTYECNVINSDYYHGMHTFMNGDLVNDHSSRRRVFFKCLYCQNEAIDYCWNCCQELCLDHISYVNKEERIGFCPICQKTCKSSKNRL
jgi:hypothetical protein